MSIFAFPYRAIGAYGSERPTTGMLLVDYFASKALQALILKQDHNAVELIAMDSYKHAIAMIKERDKLKQAGII